MINATNAGTIRSPTDGIHGKPRTDNFPQQINTCLSVPDSSLANPPIGSKVIAYVSLTQDGSLTEPKSSDTRGTDVDTQRVSHTQSNGHFGSLVNRMRVASSLEAMHASISNDRTTRSFINHWPSTMLSVTDMPETEYTNWVYQSCPQNGANPGSRRSNAIKSAFLPASNDPISFSKRSAFAPPRVAMSTISRGVMAFTSVRYG
jgi:hypothetical protein